MKSLSPTPVNGQKTDSFSGNDPQYPTKVAIVDDDGNDRRMMSQALERSVEFVCAGAYRSANEALAGIPKILPHVVLMDIRMPGMGGLECTRHLKAIRPQLKIIIVTGLGDIDTMNKSMQAGADGYLIKPIAEAQCLAMLKFIVRNGRPFRETSGSHLYGDILKAGWPLTIRENELMALLAKGFLDKEIADQLGLSFSTVHFHLRNIYRKLPAGNRTESVIKWCAADQPRNPAR